MSAIPERRAVPLAGGGPAMSYRDGIHEAMALLNGEWVVAVLASLATQPLKYMELRERINAAEERRQVSQKVLSSTLRRMRRDGLVARSAEVGTSFNPVWYELTPLGQTLLMALTPVAKWAQNNRDEVVAARARYAEDVGLSDES
jgi:DNA-binding HxlR family transcriptional regulator